MGQVSYFQRYSQPENHATNNTLLALRHLYERSPRKLEEVLRSLTDESPVVGVAFVQQEKGSHSVPDGHISQKAWDIYIESKRHGDLDPRQIERHVRSIANAGRAERSVLLGITRDPIPARDEEALLLKAKASGVRFLAITFAELLQAMRDHCADHDADLRMMLSDFEEFLSDSDLLPTGQTLAVIACGQSIAENIRFRLYFEPPERNSMKRHDFIGLYTNKSIRHLGSPEAVVVGRQVAGAFVASAVERGSLADEHRGRILDTIAACTYYPGLGASDIRYYLFGDLCSTSIIKTSKGGIRGRRILRLADLAPEKLKVGQVASARDAADMLKGATFH